MLGEEARGEVDEAALGEITHGWASEAALGEAAHSKVGLHSS